MTFAYFEPIHTSNWSQSQTEKIILSKLSKFANFKNWKLKNKFIYNLFLHVVFFVVLKTPHSLKLARLNCSGPLPYHTGSGHIICSRPREKNHRIPDMRWPMKTFYLNLNVRDFYIKDITTTKTHKRTHWIIWMYHDGRPILQHMSMNEYYIM